MGSEQIFDGGRESLHVARSEYALVDYDSIILWKIGAFKAKQINDCFSGIFLRKTHAGCGFFFFFLQTTTTIS